MRPFQTWNARIVLLRKLCEGIAQLTPSWTEAIDVLARLHQVDYRAVGLSTFGKSKDFFPRQLRTLSRISEAQARTKNTRTGAEVGPIPHFAEIVAWLGANLPPDMATIVHGDYKLDNLIFAPDSLRVIGVIDWELSTIGHPLVRKPAQQPILLIV